MLLVKILAWIREDYTRPQGLAEELMVVNGLWEKKSHFSLGVYKQ